MGWELLSFINSKKAIWKKESRSCILRFRCSYLFLSFGFLAHLSRRFKWPFLITICPSSSSLSLALSSSLLYFSYFIVFSRTTGPISTKLGTKWPSGFKFSQMKGPALFQEEIITKLRKYNDEFEKSSSPESMGQFQTNLAQIILG